MGRCGWQVSPEELQELGGSFSIQAASREHLQLSIAQVCRPHTACRPGAKAMKKQSTRIVHQICKSCQKQGTARIKTSQAATAMTVQHRECRSSTLPGGSSCPIIQRGAPTRNRLHLS